MTPRWVVSKFGGTSVSGLERWDAIARIAEGHLGRGLRPVVVCSAAAGVSDLLVDALDRVAARRPDWSEPMDAVVARHLALAADLGVDESLLDPWHADLERLLLGASMIGEVTPRLRARVMSCGELVSTTLGANWLTGRVPTTWIDARTCLRGLADPRQAHALLSARCADDADPVLAARLAELPGVLVTQGFIARNAEGDTVLLGRGGSDTSASYFAAALQAELCEIWTDVPGMFSANPRAVPQARLLEQLDYDEAQEIASTGARVLHPRCLAPLRRHRIPLRVLCTPYPELPGTTITASPPTTGPQVRAISARKGITLVSMDTVGMWQQVGFLASVFACFAKHELSVDLVSTSESNVTVSLDPVANALDPAVIAALLDDLGQYCHARAIADCAAVSLVGRRIRGMLHRLGPALEAFEEREVYLVSQAASDLNLTFVVPEADADQLVSRLHGMLFPADRADPGLGPTWEDLFAPRETGRRARWWEARAAELVEVAHAGTPVWVYDGPSIDRAAAALRGMRSVDRVFYAMKANPCPEVLRRIAAAGVGFETVSPGELDRAFQAVPDLDPDRVLYTPNFAPRGEYALGFERGVHVTLDNLHPLEAWPEVFAGRQVLLRLDPGRGRGHHEFVKTAGTASKFGIAPNQLDRVEELVARHQVEVVGLHCHAGSGILTPESWVDALGYLQIVRRRFPSVRWLDLGGGLGVPEKPGQSELDLDAVDASLAPFREANPELELWLEPGRYLVATAGVLLATVTQLKDKGGARYVGVDAGMHTLIRPALYGAWHEIANLDRLGEPLGDRVDVVGPICESGDVLGRARRLPATREGDTLLVATAGAYGRAMSSSYNLRPPAREVLLDGSTAPGRSSSGG